MNDSDAHMYAVDLAEFGRQAVGDEAVVNIVHADIAAYHGDVGGDIVRRRLQRFDQLLMDNEAAGRTVLFLGGAA